MNDERSAEPFQAEEEERNVEYEQISAHRERRYVAEKHRGSRKTAVVETYGSEQKGDACGVDHARHGEHDKVRQTERFDEGNEIVRFQCGLSSER